jgi:hypothetical protein
MDVRGSIKHCNWRQDLRRQNAVKLHFSAQSNQQVSLKLEAFFNQPQQASKTNVSASQLDVY